MAGLIRGALLGLVLLAGGCGMFSEDEERLEGERIPVRAAVGGGLVQPAAPATALPATEAEAEVN